MAGCPCGWIPWQLDAPGPTAHGEHTSIESQGYPNGAIETGQQVASDIQAALK